ncbi:MAG: ferredoxin [Sneathiella sp.]|jgi:aerobic-type carbon monoxide dehydrogenase small subunit (CoxS/CutS family)|uniref:(2Fe-2S)-binding protein n=1 Tax=Sneathiella sp. TaxID=1964365 RepID=UPI000C5BC46A|nr:(2Fe-2S)-binding protein [Sneathiella sp.]MAL80773.1 ferredoxin [Sneathiella sp.]|tara:strand:+ start:7004 stop:7492 length:489 start_codon:yes stop_codon:yes gene_type:complete
MTKRSITFYLNGRPVEAYVSPKDTLVDLLRNLDHFGARESCGQGLCGCCTVLVNGTSVSGCLELAELIEGKNLDTIEGLDAGGELSVVQQAFIDAGAFQCGFCTSGFILMVEQLLDENDSPTPDEARDYLSGNLCRCAAYPEILDAVQLAADKRKSLQKEPA